MADTLCKKVSASFTKLRESASFIKLLEVWAENMAIVVKEEPVIPTPSPPPAPVPPKKVVPPWMLTALSLQGVTEEPGPDSNPIIMGWRKILSKEVQQTYYTDAVPWCGLFVDYCIVKNGFPDCHSPLWARSWAKYGVPLARPMWGAIMTFVRDGGGHVGFLVGEDANYYHILGGNQSDQVNVARRPKSLCIGWRWPSTASDCIMVLPPTEFSSVAGVPLEVLAFAK
jgi:uncharacterized protein (TIGR02594 family)